MYFFFEIFGNSENLPILRASGGSGGHMDVKLWDMGLTSCGDFIEINGDSGRWNSRVLQFINNFNVISYFTIGSVKVNGGVQLSGG